MANGPSTGWVLGQRGRRLSGQLVNEAGFWANAGGALGESRQWDGFLSSRVVNEAGFYPLGRTDWIESGFVDEWPETASAKVQVGAVPISAVVNEERS